MEKITDKRKKLKNPSPRYTANIFSKLIFWWLRPVFDRIKNKNFKANNIYDVSPKNRCELLGNELETKWRKEAELAINVDNDKANLWKVILKTFKWHFILYIVPILILDIIRITQPIIISMCIQHFISVSTTSSAFLVTCSISFVIIFMLGAILARHLRFQQYESGTRLRVACSSLVYKKITRLSFSTVSQITNKMILHLLTKDVVVFQDFFLYVHYIWISPLQITVIIYLICKDFGAASMLGVFLLSLTILIPVYYNRMATEFYLKTATWTNERISLLTEVLNKIRVIKIYCWEQPVEKVMTLTRRYEIDILKLASYTKSFIFAISTFKTSLILTILIYIISQNVLSAEKGFSTALLFSLLYETLNFRFIKSVIILLQANTSINRIQKFLLLEEVEPYISLSMLSDDVSSISIKNASLSLTNKPNAIALENINISVPPKKLCVITGSNEARKSLLLQLILGELRPSVGEVSVNGSISYASQEPWLFPDTIRNNILCSEIYEEYKYDEIIKICELTEFFESLPSNDQTFIKNEDAVVSLECSTKINLARALYKDADIYLLDDVFTQLNDEIFECCINGLLKDKTRVIVMNEKLQRLKEEDMIIILNQNRVEYEGQLSSFENSDKYINPSKNQQRNRTMKENILGNSNTLENDLNTNIDDKKEKEFDEATGLLTKKMISKSFYWKYVKIVGSTIVFVMLLVFNFFTQLSISGSEFWIAYWTNQDELRSIDLSNSTVSLNISSMIDERDNSTIPSKTVNLTSFYVYGGFVFGTILMSIIRNLILFKICLSASEVIHGKMFARLIRAPMQFFYANSNERIVNRFTKDIEHLDKDMPVTMLKIFEISFGIFGTALLLIISNYWSIFPLILIGFFYVKINDLYISIFPKVKQLESSAKENTLLHINSALSGLPTIRCSRAQKLLFRGFSISQDRWVSSQELVNASDSAFGLWIDLLFTMFFAIFMNSLILMGRGAIEAAFVGLAIKEIFVLNGLANLGMKSSENIIAQKSNLERTLKFLELEQEDSKDKKTLKFVDLEQKGSKDENITDEKLKSWPAKGDIKFDHLYTRYSDTDEPLLKNLNFTIEAGSKIIIIEDTVLEKSSLTSALYRLANIEGSLIIDGVDTKNIDLHKLRDKIAFITQEPVFFSNTLRESIDVFHKFKDDKIWSVLEVVKLNRTYSTLDYSCSHLSLDGLKLLSLARALVNESKILVIDETSTDIDPSTDELIHEIVKEEFKDCTVLVITKRSHVIKYFDCDKFVVLDKNGRAIEYECTDGILHSQSED